MKFSVHLILLAALGPGVDSSSNRSRKLMFLGSKVQPVYRADNIVTICEPTVYTMWDPYRPPWPVMWIALLILLM
jgi:hypothetical protein